jgi:hypothetical protein
MAWFLDVGRVRLPDHRVPSLKQLKKPAGFDLRLPAAVLQHLIFVRAPNALRPSGKLQARLERPGRRKRRGREIAKIELPGKGSIETGHLRSPCWQV